MGGRRARTFVRAYNADAMARVREHVQEFSEAELERAAQRARASASRKVQPIAKRDIVERYGVKSSLLNSKFRVVEGTDRGRRGATYLGIWASDRQISLINFGGRWRKKSKGATAAITPGQRKTYAHAFIATIRGRKEIRSRVIRGNGKRYGRFPLYLHKGPSPFEMMMGRHMANGQVIAGKVLDFYSTEIKRQIALLRRKG